MNLSVKSYFMNLMALNRIASIFFSQYLIISQYLINVIDQCTVGGFRIKHILGGYCTFTV